MPRVNSPIADLREGLERQEVAYGGGERRPLGGFIAVMSVYAIIVSALGFVVKRRGQLPERINAADLALVTVATHRVSRLLTKDPVTSPLRAPFTELKGTTGPAELKEDVRGTGARKAIGELVTCPFCMAQWVATAFVFGLLLFPRATRAAASVMSIVAGANVLHLAYAKVEQAVQK